MAAAAGFAKALGGSAFKKKILTKLVGGLVLGAASQAIQRKAAQREAFEQSSPNSQFRQPITYQRIIYGEQKVSGPVTYMFSRSDNRVTDILLTLSNHPCSGFKAFWVDDVEVTLVNRAVQDAPWKNIIELYTGDGTEPGDASLLFAMTQNTAGNWSSRHKQRLCSKLYIHFLNRVGFFRDGLPKYSALVEGRLLFDPRDPSQSYEDPSTWKYSTNFALEVADYLAGYQVVADGRKERIGLGCEYDEINWDSIISAANHADELVLLGGSTQKRFQGHGTLTLDRNHEENLTKILSAGAATLTYSGGEFHLLSASYKTPSRVISLGDLRGDIAVRPRKSIRETFNAVQATFRNPKAFYQPVPTNPVRSRVAIEEDGEELLHQIELPFTNTESEALRLASLELRRNRDSLVADLPGRLQLLDLMPGDFVTFPLQELEWEDKAFEVVQCLLDGSEEEGVGQSLLIRETAPESFDETLSEEVAAAATPNTNLPDPGAVIPPRFLDVEESLYRARVGDGLKSKATLKWQASPDGYLHQYQADFRFSGETEWRTIGRTDGTMAEALDIAPGVYDFRVIAINSLGILSEPALSLGQTLSGLSAPPAAVDTFTISSVGGLAYARWTLHPDLDVQVGGTIEFRHSPLMSGATWISSTSIGEPAAGGTTSAVLPLRRGTYLARARDRSGIYSETDAVRTTEGQTILEYSTQATVQEHPSFGGTHSNTTFSDGALKLAGSGDFDATPDVDDLDNVDFAGGLALSGTYFHQNGIDLGTVKRVRIVPHIQATATLVGDTVDERPGLVDDWKDFDNLIGTIGASTDAQMWARWTVDDPNASPTWSEWERVDAGEFVARAFQLKTEISTTDPAVNEHITELGATAEGLA